MNSSSNSVSDLCDGDLLRLPARRSSALLTLARGSSSGGSGGHRVIVLPHTDLGGLGSVFSGLELCLDSVPVEGVI